MQHELPQWVMCRKAQFEHITFAESLRYRVLPGPPGAHQMARGAQMSA
jgi:hypothetical protein